MRYESTRGASPEADFATVLLAGPAPDGGLYLPAAWPAPLPPLRAGTPYVVAAEAVLAPFMDGWLAPQALRAILAEAYGSFDHPAVAPLVPIGPDRYLMELFHGPTLAFKDVAMQVLARLIDTALARAGTRALVLGATSGDTGAAAVAALAGLARVEVVILHPEGRVSEVQRRQMTTAAAPNIHNLAVAGSFDDAQRLVKQLFADEALARRGRLVAINSINWVRILAQSVYYLTACASLGADRPVTFVVPTGNFGDIYAGHVARHLGAPIARLVAATNTNDILTRVWATGRYAPQVVQATTSPAMDIQVASNFERLLFEVLDRDGPAVARAMTALADDGGFTIPGPALARMRDGFGADRADDAQAAAEIAQVWRSRGLLVDPHTAVGLSVAGRLGATPGPVVTLATAHPAKFPDAVEAACGVRPALPERLQPILSAPERMVRVAADRGAVTRFVEERMRAV